MAVEARNKFVKVKCADCENEQVVYRKPAMKVVCNVCGTTLAESTGGYGVLKGEVVEELV
jgi:small subunit ribosomal protein S27e